ncbi:type II toxin-antitoxin system PemK/MazF family toxin [Patescibacteria group bacterium]|nr:type II toxin-antitoxin system PemK/MazF family toxin [Patescibacteria group bacterium]
MSFFDFWNTLKQQLHDKTKERHFKEREIFYTHLGHNIGFEENGKGDKFLRPVIVLRKFNKQVLWAVPLGTTKKKGKYYFTFSFIENRTSTAILSQLRLIDSKRLMNKIGMISNKDFKTLKERICYLVNE